MREATEHMMMDNHGNALGSWKERGEALEALAGLITVDSDAQDEMAIMSFDSEGAPVDVFTITMGTKKK